MTFDCPSIQIRPRRLVQMLAGFAVGLAVPATFVALVARSPIAGLIAACLGAFAAVTAIVASAREAGKIGVVPGALFIERKGRTWNLPVETIEDAYATESSALYLRLRNGVEIRARVDGSAAELLDRAGLTEDRRTLVAPLRGTLGTFTRGFIAFWGSLVPALTATGALHMRGWGALVALVIAALFSTLFVQRFGRPRVVIGADGIRIMGGIRQRFIPYADIESAREQSWALPGAEGQIVSGVELRLRSGLLQLPTIGQSNEQRAALVARIERGKAAYTTRGSRALAALDRAGRTWTEWRDALRRVALGETGFREQALGREDLEAVLADPRATTERRVGAAIALREMGPDARDRVRIAADATVDDRVRIALDAAADEELDDAKLEEALRARS